MVLPGMKLRRRSYSASLLQQARLPFNLLLRRMMVRRIDELTALATLMRRIRQRMVANPRRKSFTDA